MTGTRERKDGTSGPPMRPPFGQSNLARASHGARSPRVYGDLARLLAVGLVEERPDLANYPEALAAWSTAEAQAALLRRQLGEVGPLGDDGEPRKALLEWLVRLEGLATKHRATLGLDPRSEAALARERAEAQVVAVDLTLLAERGRAALAARNEDADEAPDLAGQVLAHHKEAYGREWAQATEGHNARSTKEETQ